jgi:hypothetical protein
MRDIVSTVENNSGDLHNLGNKLQQEVLPNLQTMAFNNNTLQPGTGYLNDVLGGKYLGQANPYMQGMIDQTANDVGGRVNSTFSQAGRTGGGANQYQLSKGLADAENGLRYQDYSNERNAMTQAAGMLPQYQSAQFAGMTPLLGAYQLSGQLPYYGTQALGNLGGMVGGFGTQTGQQPGGWLNGLLSAGASLGSAAIMASDRRLKTDIRKVGEASDGLGLYTWNWKADPNGPEVRGVIADEVEKLRPWAFVPNFIGQYAGVNYGTLGSLE